MRRTLRWLMCAVLLVCPVKGMPAETVATLPAPTGYVNDFAGVLTPDTVQSLDELCTEVDQKAHAQIAVVTVKSIDPDKSGATPTIEEFATALEDKWKVGAKGTDKGVLLILVVNPAPPHGRIEVGYGLEAVLNDAKVGDIGRAMKPILVSGDYDRGISLGVGELAQDIAADAGVTLSQPAGGEQAPQYEPQPQVQVNPVVALVIGAVVLIGLGILVRTGHMGLLFFILFNLLSGGRGGGGFGGGGDGGGGDGGGGDGGGGFGGFGGGGSGGGGANF